MIILRENGATLILACALMANLVRHWPDKSGACLRAQLLPLEVATLELQGASVTLPSSTEMEPGERIARASMLGARGATPNRECVMMGRIVQRCRASNGATRLVWVSVAAAVVVVIPPYLQRGPVPLTHTMPKTLVIATVALQTPIVTLRASA